MNDDLNTWKAWLEQHQETQKAVSVATVKASEARQQMETAERHLTYLTRQKRPDSLIIAEPATTEQVQKVMEHLAKKLERSATHSDDPIHQELQRAWNDLKQTRSRFEESQAVYAECSEAQTQAEKTLAAALKARPEASPQALEAVTQAMDAHQQRIDKINGTITAMKDSTSIIADLEDQARRAAEEVDRLEASALMGEVDETAKGQATTTLAKARKAAEKAAEQAEKQASGRRGLEKIRDDLQAELTELESLQRGVGYEVGKAAVAKAERDLLEAIEVAGLQDRVTALNAARDQASFYAPEGTGYSSARIEMKLSHFYMVAAPERLEY
jgi:chromosome segregation ATPase